ncbi:MAG: hypothetical protein RLZZ605_852 [Bacteroidota bacterium]
MRNLFLLFIFITGASSAYAQAAGTPYMPNAKSAITFLYTGANQTWTVPAGVTTIQVDIYGGGASGSGARVQATIPVTPAQTLIIVVGQAGVASTAASGAPATYGGGGASGTSSNFPSQSGAGMSGIFKTSYTQINALAIAGGGGGGGIIITNTAPNILAVANGGAAGLPSGIAGTSSSNAQYTSTGGGGATIYLGGSAGGGNALYSMQGFVGTALMGGNGGNAYLSGFPNASGGGGGGGGYFGGGGGGGGSDTGTNSREASGGGGGSSFVVSGSSSISYTTGNANSNGSVKITY